MITVVMMGVQSFKTLAEHTVCNRNDSLCLLCVVKSQFKRLVEENKSGCIKADFKKNKSLVEMVSNP